MSAQGAAKPSSSTMQPKKNKAVIKTQIEAPLDFSFMNITELTDLEIEEPRALLGKTPTRNEDGKYNTKCLKLNNNVMAELKGFSQAIQSLVMDPGIISWVDLSFNELTKIDPVLCDLPNLQILNLHGNSISDIKETNKLSGIAKLKKLSLHGNPIETVKNYRFYVISNIPQLINFDMSAVTKADRATAATWKQSDVSGKKRSRKGED